MMDANITLERPFPVLYHKGSNGSIRQWQVWSEGADIVTEHGQKDGKLQIARKTATAKNVGKANATTPEIQARIEAEAMYTHKLTRKYSLSIVDCEERLMLPMLAHSFEKAKNKVTYPAYIQPKFDGVRCIARVIGQAEGRNVVQLLTRAGKQWDIPHLALELGEIMPEGLVLDGEIYIHGKTFQEITFTMFQSTMVMTRCRSGRDSLGLLLSRRQPRTLDSSISLCVQLLRC
jgi:ATP-dependent DNA ligase